MGNPQQAGLQRTEASTGAVTLIQRFGSAAILNTYLYCLVLDGVYRTIEGVCGVQLECYSGATLHAHRFSIFPPRRVVINQSSVHDYAFDLDFKPHQIREPQGTFKLCMRHRSRISRSIL